MLEAVLLGAVLQRREGNVEEDEKNPTESHPFKDNMTDPSQVLPMWKILVFQSLLSSALGCELLPHLAKKEGKIIQGEFKKKFKSICNILR